MKCKKLGCDHTAKPGYEACSPRHGADIRMYRQQIKEALEGEIGLRTLYTVEEVVTYMN